MYTWCMPVNIDQSASKRSVCLAEQYNSLSLERAREKYAANIHRLLMSLYQGLIHVALRTGSLVSRPHPRGWSLAPGIIP